MSIGIRSRAKTNALASYKSTRVSRQKDYKHQTYRRGGRSRRCGRYCNLLLFLSFSFCIVATVLYLTFLPLTLHSYNPTRYEVPVLIDDFSAALTSEVSSYTILPKKAFTIIGKESSGTKFVTRIIRDALEIRRYREGARPYEFFPKARKSFPHDQDNAIQVQHFSLPQGGLCSDSSETKNIVDVVFPAQCSSRLTLAKTIRKFKKKRKNLGDEAMKANGLPPVLQECHQMKMKMQQRNNHIHQTQNPKDQVIQYPNRYFINITSNKQWYDSQGTEQYTVIVVRDKEMSWKSRLKHHCKYSEEAAKEEDLADKIINEAIRNFILEDEELPGFQRDKQDDEDLLWDPTGFDPKKSDENNILYSSLIPSKNNVVLVSYEAMMEHKFDYVKELYRVLGIDSDHVPEFKDGNIKYKEQK